MNWLHLILASSDEVAEAASVVAGVGLTVSTRALLVARRTHRWARAMNGARFLIARMRLRGATVTFTVQLFFVLSAGASAITLPDNGPPASMGESLGLVLWARLVLQLFVSLYMMHASLRNQKDQARVEGLLND
jgi:hypothetical protein